MARNWQNLSPAYRKRLSNAGITQAQYESGVSLSKARGHSETPEHPSDIQKHPGKYRKYENSRNALTRKVIERKKHVFGGEERFHEMHSRDYVKSGVPQLAGFEQRPPSISELKRFLTLSDNQMYEMASRAARGIDMQNSALWYH